jgi:hypothetical protein
MLPSLLFSFPCGDVLGSAPKIGAGIIVLQQNPSTAAFPAVQICQTAQRDQTTIRYNRGPSDDDRSPAILGSAHIAPPERGRRAACQENEKAGPHWLTAGAAIGVLTNG